MDHMTEDRTRAAFAWLRAHATDDAEAINILTAHCDLEEVATDTAAVALLFISAYGDPAAHLDLMFRAAAMTYGARDEP